MRICLSHMKISHSKGPSVLLLRCVACKLYRWSFQGTQQEVTFIAQCQKPLHVSHSCSDTDSSLGQSEQYSCKLTQQKYEKMQADMGYKLHSHHGHTQNSCKAAQNIAEIDKMRMAELQQTRKCV